METEVISKCTFGFFADSYIHVTNSFWWRGCLNKNQTVYKYTELLIQSYYNIVKRTMVDMVPKAIMLNLVTQAKEELQRELLSELYKAEVLDDLLQESDYTKERRQECKKMIEVRIK